MSPHNLSQLLNTASNEPAGEPALAVEIERLRQALRQRQTHQIARRVGAIYSASSPGSGRLTLDLWGEPVSLDFPELIARGRSLEPLPLPIQALLVYYLTTSDGSIPAGDWVSFADLPGGRMYAQAFQGYSGNLLTRTFGIEIDSFRRACLSIGGIPGELSDAGFAFTALPRVPLFVTYWLGDDEFPSTAKILFDRAATNHLPIDVCAILGSMLVSRIIKAYKTG